MDLHSPTGFILYLLIFLLGLSVGSFLNVVIYRLPLKDLSLTSPKRSFCPACGSGIRWFDNIPLFSWIFLKARCRDCGQPISIRYPLVELATGLLALYFFHQFGLGSIISFLIYFYFAVCLLAIALIDLDWMVIPTSLMYPTSVLGLICALWEPSVTLPGPWLWNLAEPLVGPRGASLAGALMGLVLGWGALKLISVSYKLARGHEGMGDGDPPLLGMIGVYLGWRALLPVILASTLIGVASVGVMMLMAKSSPKEGWAMKALPFGPFLVLGAFIYIFFGPQLVAWYFSFLGSSLNRGALRF